MTSLKQAFSEQNRPRTKDFSLANEASNKFKKEAKRPSYKPVLDARGHVQFSNGNTRVIVENTNDGKEHNMPVAAINRYCEFIAAGKLSGITEEEKENAQILAKAIKAKVSVKAGFKM